VALSSLLRRAAAAQADEVRRQLRAVLLALTLLLLAALLLLAGLGFLLLGAYQSLAAELPSWQAGGLVALGTLFVCLLLLALAGRQGRRRAAPKPGPEQPRPGDRYGTGAEHDAVEAGAAAGEMLRRHRPSGVELGIAALVAGLVASRVSRRD
jgi:membrane protein implicated in regulation of membrane protease activity